jgi:hypothetical protein
MNAVAPGPVSLPENPTFVSDADEEIFLLYTRLATLKPPDSNRTGHFHGLGSENSKEDTLLVRIELQRPPATVDAPARKSERTKRNVGRRNKGRRRKGSSSRSDVTIGHEELDPGPVVLEYKLFQDKTALRSRSGDTGSVLWKARWALSLGSRFTF